jgi:hypothetical protein
MARTVKHFSLHRIDGTELQLISDVENGVLQVAEVEEAVIRDYSRRVKWPHECVMLFILQDMAPLIRQLQAVHDLPPGGTEALDQRPVVNVYDAGDLHRCQIFVNRQSMLKEEYWEDPLIVRALLAHEHAHPLVEGPTVRESRMLRSEVSMKCAPDAGRRRTASQEQEALRQWTGNRQDEMRALLNVMAYRLCLNAPREVLANELTIRSDFGDALLHLDRRNVANARRSLAGRDVLRKQLDSRVTQGDLSSSSADLLLLIGDMQGSLDLAIETAPFYRAGRESDGRELESVLENNVFPLLAPEVGTAYSGLRERYLTLKPDFARQKLIAWGERVLGILSEALSSKGLIAEFRLQSLSRKSAIGPSIRSPERTTRDKMDW